MSHPTCSTCRFTPTNPPRPDGRVLVSVVDELGRSAMCTFCVLTLLSRVRSSGDVTVFVARPVAVA